MTIMTQSPCVKIASSGNVVYHTAATTILCISSGTIHHRAAKLRIRPNNQAPPRNALQHLAPTIITPHYPTSYQPTSPNTTQHLSQYPASHHGTNQHNVSPCTIRHLPAPPRTTPPHATPCYTTLCSTSQHRTTPHQPALLSITKLLFSSIINPVATTGSNFWHANV